MSTPETLTLTQAQRDALLGAVNATPNTYGTPDFNVPLVLTNGRGISLNTIKALEARGYVRPIREVHYSTGPTGWRTTLTLKGRRMRNKLLGLA